MTVYTIKSMESRQNPKYMYLLNDIKLYISLSIFKDVLSSRPNKVGSQSFNVRPNLKSTSAFNNYMTLCNYLTSLILKILKIILCRAVSINYDCVKRTSSIKEALNKEYSPRLLFVLNLGIMSIVPTQGCCEGLK